MIDRLKVQLDELMAWKEELKTEQAQILRRISEAQEQTARIGVRIQVLEAVRDDMREKIDIGELIEKRKAREEEVADPGNQARLADIQVCLGAIERAMMQCRATLQLSGKEH